MCYVLLTEVSCASGYLAAAKAERTGRTIAGTVLICASHSWLQLAGNCRLQFAVVTKLYAPVNCTWAFAHVLSTVTDGCINV